MTAKRGLAAVVLAVVGVILAVALPTAEARKAADPIVGFWNFSGGVVQVSGGPTSFTGVVVKPTRFSECTHPVGEVIWRITKRGSGYVGTHQYFDDSSCVPGSGGPGQSTWAVVESQSGYVLHFCSTSPDGGSPDCDDLTRAKPVKPPTKPPTKPPPKPPPAEWIALRVDYELPDRYGNDANGDGKYQFGEVYQYVKTNKLSTGSEKYKPEREVDPKFWTARFKVTWPASAGSPANLCPVEAGKQRNPETPDYSWQIGSATSHPGVFKSLGGCWFEYDLFPKLQGFRVTVRAKQGGKVIARGETLFPMKDLLIVGLGDSNASGEGNPDNPSGSGQMWENAQCDRSDRSFQAKVAAKLELADKHTSVTFVHLACSGASIPTGLTGGYAGIQPAKGAPLRPQLEEARRLAGDRPIDAVLVSIGVNDLRFGKVVQFCLERKDCWDQKGVPGSHPGETLDKAVDRWIAELPGRYDALAASFQRYGISPGSVYITEYFNSLLDDHMKVCDPLLKIGWIPGRALTFDGDEAEYAIPHFLLPLNAAVKAAAAEHGWHYVSGAQSMFRRHGYCSPETWIVQITESTYRQWSAEGTLHANEDGHDVQARILLAALKRSGIDGKAD